MVFTKQPRFSSASFKKVSPELFFLLLWNEVVRLIEGVRNNSFGVS
jgi:hypothetical protein